MWFTYRAYPCGSGQTELLNVVSLLEELLVTALSIDDRVELLFSVPPELRGVVRSVQPLCVEVQEEELEFPWTEMIAAVAVKRVPHLGKVIATLAELRGYSAVQLYIVASGNTAYVETRVASDSERRLAILLRTVGGQRAKVAQKKVLKAMMRGEPLNCGVKVRVDELRKSLVVDAGKLSRFSVQLPADLPWIPLEEFIEVLAGGRGQRTGQREQRSSRKKQPSRGSRAR